MNPPPMNTRCLLDLVAIPEEILADEILARLPVKSLSRFKCVSKSWLSLIESDRFIKIHYRNSAKNPRVITLNLKVLGISVGCSLQSLFDSKEGISVPTKMEPKVGSRLLGCCNGVLCFFNYQRRRFSLWNPATRVFAELPGNGGGYLRKWGFGRDESSGAYKVFVVLYECRFSKVRSGWVYSSNTNSWRKSPGGSDLVLNLSGRFLCGNLHWVADRGLPHVECFDLGREEFGRMELPYKDEGWKKGQWYFPRLGVIGGSLGLLLNVEKGLEVWLMEYGVKDSWLKILTFPSTVLSDPWTYSTVLLFGEGPNGEIFVGYGKKLTVYSPKEDAFSTVTSKDRFTGPRIYVESLVSPKRILDATSTTR